MSGGAWTSIIPFWIARDSRTERSHGAIQRFLTGSLHEGGVQNKSQDDIHKREVYFRGLFMLEKMSALKHFVEIFAM